MINIIFPVYHLNYYICNIVSLTHRMNRQFRHILSVLLLLVYGFILTPVSLWHSHTCESTVFSDAKIPASEKQVVKASHSCLICDHTYSIYTIIDDCREEYQLTDYQEYHETFYIGIISLFQLQCNTRGSPAAEVLFPRFI